MGHSSALGLSNRPVFVIKGPDKRTAPRPEGLVDAELRKRIDEILGGIYCPDDYGCFGPGVEQYRSDGQTKFVACLKSDPAECALAAPRNGARECRCVLRATLLEKLH